MFIKLLHEEGLHATPPRQATEGSAGYDLFAAEDVLVPSCSFGTVRTQLAVALPHGHTGLVCSRSGMAAKHGVFVLNAPGVIDSDYCGEIGVILCNIGMLDYEVHAGDRIAQLLIVAILHPPITLVEALEPTARGEGGFGHSGT